MTDNQVLQVSRESGAMIEGHFIHRRGLHSRQFFQCALALQQMSIIERLGAALPQTKVARSSYSCFACDGR